MENEPEKDKEKFWRKAWFFGVGLVDFTRTKIEGLVEDLVKRGEISQQEKPQAVEEMWARAKSAQEALFEKVKEMVPKAISGMKLARAAGLEALEKRVAALEKKLGAVKPAKKAAAKKAPAKKEKKA
jgi:polyhydroxyalkanoate synthesis regulator phasin